MKKLTMLFVATFAFGCLAFGAQHVFYGVVSDSMCGAKHHRASAAAATCVKNCAARGAKYVLVRRVAGTYKVYQVTPQEKFTGFPGKRVRVEGSLSGDTITAQTVAAVHYKSRAKAKTGAGLYVK